MQKITTTFDDLIGKPFAWNGRGPEVYDCYGLMVECARRDGVLLPDYPSEGDYAPRVLEGIETGWRKIEPDEVRRGDGVVLKIAGQFHIGYMEDSEWFMHIVIDQTVTRASIHRAPWKGRIIGFYRRVK